MDEHDMHMESILWPWIDDESMDVEDYDPSCDPSDEDYGCYGCDDEY
jgi:hypothetical protein